MLPSPSRLTCYVSPSVKPARSKAKNNKRQIVRHNGSVVHVQSCQGPIIRHRGISPRNGVPVPDREPIWQIRKENRSDALERTEHHNAAATLQVRTLRPPPASAPVLVVSIYKITLAYEKSVPPEWHDAARTRGFLAQIFVPWVTRSLRLRICSSPYVKEELPILPSGRRIQQARAENNRTGHHPGVAWFGSYVRFCSTACYGYGQSVPPKRKGIPRTCAQSPTRHHTHTYSVRIYETASHVPARPVVFRNGVYNPRYR